MAEVKKDNPLAGLMAMGLSRYAIAKKGGWSHTTVRSWWKGWSQPNVRNAARLEQMMEEVGKGE